jgi:hypothetical protein
MQISRPHAAAADLRGRPVASVAPSPRVVAAASAAAPLSRRRSGSVAASAPSAPPLRRRPGSVVASASSGGNDNKTSGSSDKDKKTEEYVEGLKKAGVDAAAARKILDTWKAAAGGTDADDPAALRKLFLKQSAAPLLAVSAQVVIDTLAAFFAFNSGVLIDLSASPPSFAKSAAVAAATVLAGWFACGALIDVVTLGALLYALLKLGASPEALLAAVKTIAAGSGTAGAASGLMLADRAANAVNAVKVTAALDAIAGLVQSGSSKASSSSSSGSAPNAASTLRDLSAFLVLQQAERNQGFVPETFGITEKQAMDWAFVFSDADKNSDGALSELELKEMCASLGVELSADEARAVRSTIDSNGDGQVTFSEFAQWFAERNKVWRQSE